MTERDFLRTRIRVLLGLFVAGLLLSGLTAFPLRWELDLVTYVLGISNAPSAEGHTGLNYWILTVREGLRVSYAQYPFLAYGTDWLAFGHIVIALFFIGPILDPARNVWVIQAGMIACVLVIPLALICGPIRGIPFYWRLIDCSFGVIGLVPLWYALRLTRRIERKEEG